MPTFSRHKPLTDAELERLAGFMDTGHAGAMSLEEMDGFLVALVCGPEVVLPSEYLPLIWGGDPSFATSGEARQCLHLLMCHWNTIASTLRRGTPYFPLLLEGEDGIARGNDWASGFMRGMHLRHDAWGELVNDGDHGGIIVPILALAHEHDPDPSLRPEPITPKQREKLLAHLTAGIVLIYRYFRKSRAAHANL